VWQAQKRIEDYPCGEIALPSLGSTCTLPAPEPEFKDRQSSEAYDDLIEFHTSAGRVARFTKVRRSAFM
jgi:hypothetical protein